MCCIYFYGVGVYGLGEKYLCMYERGGGYLGRGGGGCYGMLRSLQGGIYVYLSKILTSFKK